MRSPGTFAVVLLGATLLLAGARPAAADPRTERAREHYLQGDAYYKLDKYKEALGEYEQAYIAKPDASFLYNIAQCHRLMGNRAEALKFYRRYLKDAPGAPNRPVAEKHIRDLEAALAHGPDADGSASSPAGAAGAPSSGAPTVVVSPTSTTPPPAGPQRLALEAPAHDATAPASNLAGEGAPATTSARDDHHPFYTRWWFWTAVGAVVVGGIVLAAASRGDPACPMGITCK